MDRLMLLVCFFLWSRDVSAENASVSAPGIVIVKSHINVKFFEVPTSDDPVLTWIEIQRGVFPYTTVMEGNRIRLGEPLTIYVYLRDKSKMYDVRVTQCWASDSKNPTKAKNKFLLTGIKYRKGKIIGDWQKYILPDHEEIRSFLYTTFKAFKFPEIEQIYISCDVELCFKACRTGYKLSNLL